MNKPKRKRDIDIDGLTLCAQLEHAHMKPSHLAQLARLLRRPHILGQEPKLLRNTPRDALLPRDLTIHRNQPLGADDIGPDRFLRQHVLAGAQGGFDVGRLRGDGQGDEDGLDVWAGEDVGKVLLGRVFGVELDGCVGGGEEGCGGLGGGEAAGVEDFEA